VENKSASPYPEACLRFFDSLCPLMKQKYVKIFLFLGGSTGSSNASNHREE
jgi:hypothetical protein